MALEGGADGPPSDGLYTSRFAAIGAVVPERRVTTDALMASTKHRTHIELERLTGIRERHVVAEGEDSYTLALGAARDALAHWDGSCRGSGRADRVEHEPVMWGVCERSSSRRSNVSLKEALGAGRAMSFDLANACAGMLTGVFILNDLIRRAGSGVGWSSAASTSQPLGANAAREVRTVMSKQLASLTLGDAGAAAILERAPEGARDRGCGLYDVV